jgi:hypothetical protein
MGTGSAFCTTSSTWLIPVPLFLSKELRWGYLVWRRVLIRTPGPRSLLVGQLI